MSSGLYEKFRIVVYSAGVLDIEGIRRDLIRMRGTMTQRAFARKIGASSTRVQNLEKGTTDGLDLELVDIWLRGCGSSLALYFAMRAKREELESIAASNRTVELFLEAMKTPATAAMLAKIVAAVLHDGLRPEK